MGLDMYLEGRLFQWFAKPGESDEQRYGRRVKQIAFDLGYWRKHPDLHGYIVQNFAEGEDNCQDIWLSRENVEQIMEAIANDNLAHGTQGFFFGRSYQPGEKDDYGSYEQQKAEDLQIWREALAWFDERLADPEKRWSPDIFYRASW